MYTLCTAVQVLAPLLDRGDIDGARLQSAQYEFDQFTALQRRQRFMLLQLDPAARAGEPRALDQVTAHRIWHEADHHIIYEPGHAGMRA